MSQKFQRRRLNKDDSPVEQGEGWIVSFSDIMSLLFCLFSVLYGMSKVNEGKFRQLAEALSRSLSSGGFASSANNKTKSTSNIQEGGEDKEFSAISSEPTKNTPTANPSPSPDISPSPSPSPEEPPNSGKGNSKIVIIEENTVILKGKEYDNLYDVEKKLNKVLQSKGLNKYVIARMEERGLVVGLMTDQLVFKLGEAELMPHCERILDELSPVLKDCNNPIRIEGNTCNLPIYTERFRSNWELSTMRATNVAEYLIRAKKIKPERISIIGYGEYRPMFPNNSEGNRSKNRRVDIVIMGSYATYLDKKNSESKNNPPEKAPIEKVEPQKAETTAAPAGENADFWESMSSE